MNKTEIEKLHSDLLTAWNRQDAIKMASLFTSDGISIGFDGSRYQGRKEIEFEIANIFHHHQTAEYVWKVREIRFLQPAVAMLEAVVGMLPPKRKEINPATNAIQTVIALQQNEEWQIALFQNTPAQFHGRPEMANELTEELSALLAK